jgi:hypothetical protein
VSMSQLFLQLADQRGLGRLAGFDLAAGELPQAGQRLALRALRQKHAAIGVDQGDGRDEDNLHGSCALLDPRGPAPGPPGILGQKG